MLCSWFNATPSSCITTHHSYSRGEKTKPNRTTPLRQDTAMHVYTNPQFQIRIPRRLIKLIHERKRSRRSLGGGVRWAEQRRQLHPPYGRMYNKRQNTREKEKTWNFVSSWLFWFKWFFIYYYSFYPPSLSLTSPHLWNDYDRWFTGKKGWGVKDRPI